MTDETEPQDAQADDEAPEETAEGAPAAAAPSAPRRWHTPTTQNRPGGGYVSTEHGGQWHA